MFRSLRIRLALTNVVALFVILIGLGSIGVAVLSREIDRQETRELLEATRTEMERLRLNGGEDPYIESREDPSDASTIAAVFATDGTPIAVPNPLPSWLRPQSEPLVDVVVPSGDTTRMVTRALALSGGRVIVVVMARSLDRVTQTLDQVRRLLWFGAAAAFLLSGAVGWWLSGRSMRPIQWSYEAQRRFASDASHELRTPLTFIRAGVEVLAPHQPDLGNQVLEEIDYMTGTTERLLLLARAERRDMALDRLPFDLAEVCRSAADRSQRVHGTHLEIEGGDAVALGDAMATESVLDVLLENVARYAGGAAELRWSKQGARYRVTVTDHGRGLPPEELERVFDRFARPDASRDRAAGGAGLGLPLARELATAEGGTLKLAATPGGGVTATLELPAA